MGVTETVLLVDDEPALCEIVAEMLRSADFIVLEASDPEGAVLVASRAGLEINLVIVDAGLAGGGAATAALVQAKHPGAAVLLVSGDTPREERTGDPGIPFLGKPFGLTDLLRKVREVLDRKP